MRGPEFTAQGKEPKWSKYRRLGAARGEVAALLSLLKDSRLQGALSNHARQ